MNRKFHGENKNKDISLSPSFATPEFKQHSHLNCSTDVISCIYSIMWGNRNCVEMENMYLLYKYLLQTPITSSSYTTSFKVINFYMLFTEKLLSLRHLYLFPLLSDLAQHVALLSCNLKLVIISHSFHGQKYFCIEKYFFTVKHLQLIHSQTFYILLSFFLGCFFFH